MNGPQTRQVTDSEGTQRDSRIPLLSPKVVRAGDILLGFPVKTFNSHNIVCVENPNYNEDGSYVSLLYLGNHGHLTRQVAGYAALNSMEDPLVALRRGRAVAANRAYTEDILRLIAVREAERAARSGR